MKHLICFFVLFFMLITPVEAIVDPLASPNNKHGVHIVDEHDLDDVAKLVNSSGGEWGYVTMVIREDERNVQRWQTTFDRMRELKLIPIIRIATHATENGWDIPEEKEAQEWAYFLNKLNWVVQNRYVILFNEPNHAHEWDGTINPEEYARLARIYRDTLKDTSEDFFVLPAGFDQAAGNTSNSMDAERYFERMAAADPDIFTIFDGWTSHAYPNPNFSGSVTATGRSTIRGYEWEYDHLKQFGFDTDLPVFITETGWAHREGTTENLSFKSAEEVADLFERAYTQVWQDDHIVMISPFILNYQDEPFDNFSWKMPNSSEYYPQYSRLLGISKTAGLPAQTIQAHIKTLRPISELTTQARFYVPILITNTGQSIWEESRSTHMIITTDQGDESTVTIRPLKPYESELVKIPLNTPDVAGSVSFSIETYQNDLTIAEPFAITIAVRPHKSYRNILIQKARELISRRMKHTVFAQE